MVACHRPAVETMRVLTCKSWEAHDRQLVRQNLVVNATGKANAETSHWLIAEVRLRWEVQGMREFIVASIHVHRDTGARAHRDNVVWNAMMDELASDLCSRGVRVLAGDLNKGIAALGPSLEAHGMQVSTIGPHVNLNVFSTLPGGGAASDAEVNLHFDTVGI